MCADCRVIAQAESDLDPYAGPALPKPKTVDDYRDWRAGWARSVGEGGCGGLF